MRESKQNPCPHPSCHQTISILVRKDGAQIQRCLCQKHRIQVTWKDGNVLIETPTES